MVAKKKVLVRLLNRDDFVKAGTIKRIHDTYVQTLLYRKKYSGACRTYGDVYKPVINIDLNKDGSYKLALGRSKKLMLSGGFVDGSFVVRFVDYKLLYDFLDRDKDGLKGKDLVEDLVCFSGLGVYVPGVFKRVSFVEDNGSGGLLVYRMYVLGRESGSGFEVDLGGGRFVRFPLYFVHRECFLKCREALFKKDVRALEKCACKLCKCDGKFLGVDLNLLKGDGRDCRLFGKSVEYKPFVFKVFDGAAKKDWVRASFYRMIGEYVHRLSCFDTSGLLFATARNHKVNYNDVLYSMGVNAINILANRCLSIESLNDLMNRISVASEINSYAMKLCASGKFSEKAILSQGELLRFALLGKLPDEV